jgi:hypothetical protein
VRTEPLPSVDQIPFVQAVPQHTELRLIVHASWLLAGMAIALAACTVADESDLHAQAPSHMKNLAHAEPQPNAPTGNVQDLTY